MDWECAFLYNLSNNIPGRWSLKRPLKMVAIFCVNTVQDVSKIVFCPILPCGSCGALLGIGCPQFVFGQTFVLCNYAVDCFPV